MHREPEVLRQKPKWKNVSTALQALPQKNLLAPIHSVRKWHPPECLFYKSDNGCRFCEMCSYAHRQFDEQPSKKSQKNGDRSAVAMLKSTRQLGCAFQDFEPPKSSSIFRKSSNIRKPIRCVQYTKAVVRHANIREQNPSLGMICRGDLHQRNTNAPKFEDRSQEESGKSKVPAKQRGSWPKVC